MSGRNRVIVLAALAASVLCPRPTLALDVQQFANMTTEDQKHYLAFLVNKAQQLLIQQGEQDQAEKTTQLFRDSPPGSDRSLGASQFHSALTSTLDYFARVPAPLQGTMRSSVESLLSQVLVKNGITLTRGFTQTLEAATRNRAFYQKPR